MNTYQVIIVEDDPMVASINRQYLQSNPELQIIGDFRNGSEALDFLEKHPADLAVIDYYMPVMDGREFVRQCREKKISIHMIMITAANQAQQITEMLQLGVIDYLVKPFTFERFQAAITRFIHMKGILRPNAQLSQEQVDAIVSGTAPAKPPLLDKGLQEQTLALIRRELENCGEGDLSSNEIAGRIGVSRITVRRYMNYLLENHEIVSRIDYATGGRPSIRYKKTGPCRR